MIRNLRLQVYLKVRAKQAHEERNLTGKSESGAVRSPSVLAYSNSEVRTSAPSKEDRRF